MPQAKEYNFRAITLNSRDSGEKDVLVTFYTLERGRVQLMVKGTKKAVSSLRGAVSPLNAGECFAVERRGIDLLTEWLPVNSFPGIKSDIEKTALALYFARFASEFTASWEPEPKLYYLLENIFNILQQNRRHAIMRMVFEWSFLSICGLSFGVDECARCGGRLGRQSRAFLDVPEGEVLCGRCSEESGKANLFLGLGLSGPGKLLENTSSALSGDLYRSDTQIKRAGGFIEELFREMDGAGPGAVARMQSALSRFVKFHVGAEYSDSWLVRL